MTPLDVVEIYVFVLAAFVGYQVITRVPPLLHTPLMSATNAISGISLVGSLVAAGSNHGTLSALLGAVERLSGAPATVCERSCQCRGDSACRYWIGWTDEAARGALSKP